MYTCVAPTSGASLTHYSTPLGHRRASGWVLWAMQQLAILHMVVYIRQRYFLNLIHTLLHFLRPYVHSLRLRLNFCPANGSIRTTFLDSTYMHYYLIYFFLTQENLRLAILLEFLHVGRHGLLSSGIKCSLLILLNEL